MAERRGILLAAVMAGIGGIAAWAWRFSWFVELPAAPVFATDGVAINGIDPVAYFTQGSPVQGSLEHSFTWRGATWLFASAENRGAFEADPERYAPQYGGFCAWAIAEKGKLYATKPENWTIVNNKLYLNFNDEIQTLWENDIPGFIAKADARWPELSASG